MRGKKRGNCLTKSYFHVYYISYRYDELKSILKRRNSCPFQTIGRNLPISHPPTPKEKSMFAHTIITALALLVGFVASASAQQCRTVYNPQSGQVLERDCSTFQTANQGGNQGQNNLTVGQIFLLDNRIQYNNPDHVLERCSHEEERNLFLKQVLTLTFQGASNGWAQTDDRYGTNTGSRIGFARGVNAALATQCFRVVARPVQQQLVVTAQVVQVTSSVGIRPCIKIDNINYGNLNDVQCAAIVPRGNQSPTQLSASNQATKNADGYDCFLNNRNGVLVYDFLSTSANNPLGKPIVTGEECLAARNIYGGN